MVIDPRIKATVARVKTTVVGFCKKYNRQIFIGLFCVWILLSGINIGMLRGLNLPKAFVFIMVNVVGQAFGAGIAYGGLRWSIRSWRSTKWMPMIAGTIITIIGLTILVFCPLFWAYWEALNHAVYECMIALGETTIDNCNVIVRTQANAQPWWDFFPHYQR